MRRPTTRGLVAAVVGVLFVAACFTAPREEAGIPAQLPAPRTDDAIGPTIRVALGVVPRGEAPSLEPGRDGLVRFHGKPYRGLLRAVITDSGQLVVNEVGLEAYLRGVVPLELGERPVGERAALEAQAIAARSFTVTRVSAARAGRGRSTHFDLLATVSDQVYGGVDAERPNASAAVAATAGLVLTYGGRVIVAPYHSSCGGETAAAAEVWGGTGEPFLQRASDRIPGSDRYYCDVAPRFSWERALSGAELDAVVRRYLGTYATLPTGGPGAVRDVRIARRTPSGRAQVVEFRTASGTFDVRGNDARSILRSGAGELMPSSYFSVTVEASPDGAISRVQLRGNGYGHGVGMCQWGAIGRARAGQSARSILQTYFPGTTLGSIPSALFAQ